MSEFLKLVGENIRKIRKSKQITQEMLGERTELQYTFIGGVERGKRNISLRTLEKIAIGLEIDPYKLLNFGQLDLADFDKKSEILEIHKLLLEGRSTEEIKYIHNIVKDILLLLDKGK
jgi:transcriptional regulator with XRE-family HTH domain